MPVGRPDALAPVGTEKFFEDAGRELYELASAVRGFHRKAPIGLISVIEAGEEACHQICWRSGLIALVASCELEPAGSTLPMNIERGGMCSSVE